MTTKGLTMRTAGLRVPDHLPVAAGLLTTILVAAYLLAPVLAEIQLGRPSSTAGIGLFIGPLTAVLCGGFVLVIAMLFRWVARRADVPSMTVPMWLVVCILLAAAGAVVVLNINARALVATQEFERRPRVIVESARIVKMPQPPRSTESRVEAPLLFSIYAENTAVPSIEWNGRAVSVAGKDEQVTVLDAAGSQLAATDLHAFDYIGLIHATPFCRHPDGSSDLAVLVTLRATSNRSMLILYGADGAVIHQEHLERTRSGIGRDGLMSVVQSEGSELLVVDHGAVDAYACSAG
jgi:hypothetical protein